MKKQQAAPAPAAKSQPSVTSTVLFYSQAVLLAGVIALIPTAIARNKIFHDPLSIWESAVKSAPNKRRTHENYGQALSTAGKLNEALTQFKTVLALPDDGSVPMRDVYREIGVVYFRLGLIDESIIAWQKGLFYANGDAGVLNNLAIAYMRQGRLDEALSHAQMAVSVAPFMPEPVNTMGEIYMATKRYAEAANSFLQYVQMRPEDGRGYWNAGLAFERAGDLDKAYQLINRFLATDPDPNGRQQAQNLLMNLQARMGKNVQR